jgi:hypothetical protein
MASLFESQFQNQRPLTGARVGIREELSDLITNVDAKETPISSMAKRGSKPGNTTFRWQVDRNPEPSVELGILDGKDVDPNNLNSPNAGLGGSEFKQYTIGYRTEVENNIHLFRRAVHVSNLTQDILNLAGVKDELSRQLAKATIDLKRSMEITFTSDILPALDDGTTPYRTRCLTSWIKKDKATALFNNDKYGVQNQQIRSIDENFCTPESSIVGTGTSVTELNENTVQDLMTSVYEQTGQFKNHEAVVGTKLKRQFTELVYTTRAPSGPSSTTGIRSTRDASSDSIKASVDYFEGDFGKLALIPTQFLHAGVNPYGIKETLNGSNVATYTLYDGHQGTETNRVKAQTGDGNTAGAITGVTPANVNASKNTMLAAAGNALAAENLSIVAATGANPTAQAANNAAAYALAKHRANLHLENAKCKGFVIPWDMLEVRYGGNIAQVRELTENGGGPRRMMEAMAALLVHSPLTFGMFDYKANNA